MGRASWVGTMVMGEIEVPVALHPAGRHRHPRFHLLHAADQGAVRVAFLCDTDDRPLKPDEIVRGYEHQPGQYVTLSPEELRGAALHNDRILELVTFVGRDEVDPRYCRRPFYLTPGRRGEVDYALLCDALREAGQAAIGQLVLRGRPLLCLIYPADGVDGVLLAEQLRFDEELIPPEEIRAAVKRPAAAAADREHLLDERRAALRRAIGQRTDRFTPARYVDRARQNLLRLIAARVSGGASEGASAPAAPRPRLRRSRTRTAPGTPAASPSPPGSGLSR